MVATARASAFVGQAVTVTPRRSATKYSNVIVASKKGKKIDINKVGVSSIDNDVVKANLQGRSRAMDKKDWVDAAGKKGKGYNVYRFSNKYGANVDGYSPIYTPDIWSEGGDTYKLGSKGLLAWAGLIVVLLGISINLIVSTSQLGS